MRGGRGGGVKLLLPLAKLLVYVGNICCNRTRPLRRYWRPDAEITGETRVTLSCIDKPALYIISLQLRC